MFFSKKNKALVRASAKTRRRLCNARKVIRLPGGDLFVSGLRTHITAKKIKRSVFQFREIKRF